MRTTVRLAYVVLVWVCFVAVPVFAQDVSPNEDVKIPGWVWVLVVSSAGLIGFGIWIGILKGNVSNHGQALVKLTADFETYKKEVTAEFEKHEKEDRDTYAAKAEVAALDAKKASREYVDGLLNGITSKFDLVLGRIEQMKNDMDRQFMFLRQDRNGNIAPPIDPNEPTNPGGTPPRTRR